MTSPVDNLKSFTSGLKSLFFGNMMNNGQQAAAQNNNLAAGPAGDVGDDEPFECRSLVEDYIRFRLERAGFAWSNANSPEVNVLNGDAGGRGGGNASGEGGEAVGLGGEARAGDDASGEGGVQAAQLGAQQPQQPQPFNNNRQHQVMRDIATEFEQRYEQVFRAMTEQLHLTPSTAQSTFHGIVDELFVDGVTWGRVVALYAFGGALCVHCVHVELQQLIPSIARWVTQYVEGRLAPWIRDHGGWTEFVNFYAAESNRATNPFSKWSRWVYGAAAGAAAAITLGAFMAHKA